MEEEPFFDMDNNNHHHQDSQPSSSYCNLIRNSKTTIECLYEKYSDDLFMVSKIHHYISQQLPTLLDNIKMTRERNAKRIEEHNIEYTRFLNQYLKNNSYYYHTINETYFHYDSIHYTEISEDAIIHNIVSTISKDRNPLLMDWKYKTKVAVMKKIKENPILKAIPESKTIQNVLNHICPIICSTKSEAKYFLTVIGDNILKKNNNHIHFISYSVREVLKYINQLSIEYLNIQSTQSFKYKYHERHMDNENECRMIPTTELMQNAEWFKDFLQKNGIDLLCVACHYSNKYGSSDEFIQGQDNDLQTYVMKLTTPPLNVIKTFSAKYLYCTDIPPIISGVKSQSYSPQEEYFLQKKNSDEKEEQTDKNLTWKHMQFLWRDFLKAFKYPPNLYQNILKKTLMDKLFPGKYNIETEIFEGIASFEIPAIEKFLNFWSETIIEDNNTYAQIEMEEVVVLFRKWLTNVNQKLKQKYLLKENKILDILGYFHPELEIKDNKYIYGIRCILWDKDVDIDNSLTSLREYYNETVEKIDGKDVIPTVTLYNAYQYYCKFYNSKVEERGKTLLVSKSYFENYVYCHYKIYLDSNNTFIEQWFSTY